VLSPHGTDRIKPPPGSFTSTSKETHNGTTQPSVVTNNRDAEVKLDHLVNNGGDIQVKLDHSVNILFIVFSRKSGK